MRLLINPNAKIEWLDAGKAPTSIMIVDDFLSNPQEVRNFALTLRYHTPGKSDYYPGLKAYADLGGTCQVVEWIAERMLDRLFANRQRPEYITLDDTYSICAFATLACDRTQLPARFVDQHVDGRAWLATVLHLSLNCANRATAFWEHRATGLQSWPRADIVRVRQLEDLFGLRIEQQLNHALSKIDAFNEDAIEKLLFQPTPGRRPFSSEEDENWKLIGLVPAAFNRIVVYPTWQIHSIVDMTEFPSLTTDNVRLTMNHIVEYPLCRSLHDKSSTYPQRFYQRIDGLDC